MIRLGLACEMCDPWHFFRKTLFILYRFWGKKLTLKPWATVTEKIIPLGAVSGSSIILD